MNFSKKAAVMALTASALPYVASATEINWSEISSIIEGAATVFGSVVAVIIAVVPILIILAVVGFITGVFAGVLSSVERKI